MTLSIIVKLRKKILLSVALCLGCHNTQHIGIKFNKIQHNDTKFNQIQHNDTKVNNTQHNDTKVNNTQHNDTQFIQLSVAI